MLLLLLSLLSCANPGGTVRGNDDTTDTDAPSDVELAAVSHDRELRGAWVATVWNINFPSSSNLSVDAQTAELQTLVDTLADNGFNAVFFQVRPEGDALYDSQHEPWSHVLSGTQGQDPGYDPLAVLISKAHARNVEVHAWMNPYRAKAAAGAQAAPHIAVTHPELVHGYSTYEWMDPGSPIVRQRLVDVVTDVATHYDVDGIHFDDYFYPYPDGSNPFPDDATWAVYQSGGGALSRDDWRRDNVNSAMREVNAAVQANAPHVRFGVSPFGIYRPGQPAGISGFDQYEGLYADPKKWMDEGWLDYLAPQLYWPTTQTAQAYEPLIDWWSAEASGGRYIFAGNNLAELGSASMWSASEFEAQVGLSRAAGPASQGNIMYNIGPLLEDRDGIQAVFRDGLYATPALTPPLSTAAERTLAPPVLTGTSDGVTLAPPADTVLRAVTVYRQDGESWVIDRIEPGATTALTLGDGVWAVAGVDRYGVESQGVVVRR